MTPAERKFKKQLQQKRIEVLDKISVITKQNCASCSIVERYSAKDCAECITFKKINELGKELTAITKSKPRIKLKSNGKLASFTKEEYFKLKADGLNQASIARKKGVTSAAIYDWVKRNIKQAGIEQQ